MLSCPETLLNVKWRATDNDPNRCCCCSVTQLGLTLCDPRDCSLPSFPVHHQPPEFAQTHVHRVGDATQPSHPLSVTPFSSCCQSFPARGFFPISQFFTAGGQSIGASASTPVLRDWLIWSPCCPRDSQESSPAPQFEGINCLALNLLYGPTLTSIHDYKKNHSLTTWTIVVKVMSLLFNTWSRFDIGFLPRSKRLLILWLSHHPHWFWSSRKWNLILFPHFLHLLAMKW